MIAFANFQEIKEILLLFFIITWNYFQAEAGEFDNRQTTISVHRR